MKQMARFERSVVLSSSDSSPPELFTPSPTEDILEPSILANNIPLPNLIQQKYSIHHQDAEASIADVTDCLRTIRGKMEWFYRKQQFCPHLISNDDAKQISDLHKKILIEEIPFIELQNQLKNGINVDIPSGMQGRISTVCSMFNQLKQRIDNLRMNVLASSPQITTAAAAAATTSSTTSSQVSQHQLQSTTVEPVP